MAAVLMRYSLTVPKDVIYYISWTVDAYEGLGFLRTDDADTGAVSLLYSSDYADEVEALLDVMIAEGVGIVRGACAEETTLEDKA